MNERRAFLKGLVGSALPKGSDPLTQGGSDPLTPVSDADLWLERYSRQLVLPQWSEAAQRALGEASVLVVGAGALGSPVATYLAGAGVGRLGVVDDGAVELSNLHRQHLHFTPDLGVPKAHSAAAKLAFLNNDVLVEPYQAAFSEAMLEGQDLVVDCTDAFATRYAINAACCAAGVRLVEGGVLGPAAGVIGSLQALEALKLITGVAPAIADGFLQVDLAAGEFLRVHASRRDDCPDCGNL